MNARRCNGGLTGSAALRPSMYEGLYRRSVFLCGPRVRISAGIVYIGRGTTDLKLTAGGPGTTELPLRRDMPTLTFAEATPSPGTPGTSEQRLPHNVALSHAR